MTPAPHVDPKDHLETTAAIGFLVGREWDALPKRDCERITERHQPNGGFHMLFSQWAEAFLRMWKADPRREAGADETDALIEFVQDKLSHARALP